MLQTARWTSRRRSRSPPNEHERGDFGRPAPLPSSVPPESPAVAPGFSFMEATVSKFTIETTYRLLIFRQRNYEADTIDQACRLALEDDDWSDEKRDYESAGDTYVTGIWDGPDAAYRGRAQPVPSQFAEAVQRKAEHFEILVGVLKILAHADDLQAPDLPFWLPRAQAAIAKAESILAGAPDPEGTSEHASVRSHVLVSLDESSVREQIASIIEADPTLTTLSPDAISDAEINTACRAHADAIDLSEERGAAEFCAALGAIRAAERRLNTLNPVSGGSGDAADR